MEMPIWDENGDEDAEMRKADLLHWLLETPTCLQELLFTFYYSNASCLGRYVECTVLSLYHFRLAPRQLHVVPHEKLFVKLHALWHSWCTVAVD